MFRNVLTTLKELLVFAVLTAFLAVAVILLGLLVSFLMSYAITSLVTLQTNIYEFISGLKNT